MKHLSKKAWPSRSQRLETIWAVIEARESFPQMIVVTSATPSDDTQSLARGLAQTAYSTGLRTALLQLAAGSTSSANSGTYAALSVAPRGPERQAFDAASAAWRTMYDAIIIDAATIGSVALGAHVIRVSDGVIVGLCDQRRVVPADREIVRLIQDLRASFLGVVMTAPSDAGDPLLLSRDPGRLATVAQY